MSVSSTPRQVVANFRSWVAALSRAPRSPTALFLDPSRLWLIAAGAAAIAVAIGITILTIDTWAFALMHRLPNSLVAVFDQITDFGKSGWLLFPLAFLLLCIAALPPLPRIQSLVIATLTVRLGFLFVAIAVPGLLTLFLKYLIGRARPYAAAGDPFVFTHFLLRSDYASLPSGHSTTAFAAAAAIGAVWPKVGTVAWSYALIIGASRIIVTAHFPSDVITSAVVGVTGAVLVRNYFAARRFVFSIHPDGSVRSLTGPSLQRLKRTAVTLVSQFVTPRNSGT
jgi:membrane-associated phospholipid phosphatase